MKPRHVPILLSTVFVCGASTLTAQQPGAGDPFVKGDDTPAAAPQPALDEPARLVPQGLIRAEYFSLPHTLARKMMRQLPQQQALYEWLGKELENPQSEVKLERLSLLKVRGGQRSKVEEIDEYPYSTEFDPPQIPQSIGIGAPLSMSTNNNNTTVNPPAVPAPPNPPKPKPAPAPAPGAQGDPGTAGAEAQTAVIAPGAVPATHNCAPWPYSTVTPRGFTFRNTGWTMEAEMTIGADGRTVDLNLAPEHVKIVSVVPQVPNGEITQPVFETYKLTTQVLTIMNQPTLVGTISPPVATGTSGANETNRTWLLFITVNPAR